MNVLEEGAELDIEFEKLRRVGGSEQPVIPVVLQNADSGDVLLTGFGVRLDDERRCPGKWEIFAEAYPPKIFAEGGPPEGPGDGGPQSERSELRVGGEDADCRDR